MKNIICCDYTEYSNGHNVIRWYLDDKHPETKRQVIGTITAHYCVAFADDLIETEIRARLFGAVFDIDNVLDCLDIGSSAVFVGCETWWNERFLP